ncbi:hypothetical protein B9Z19DRAFT_838245 [Tuber borchii]|uniref:Uncharacterized protein n=1 Tax=Tuber borchii TaxID=42251 RepID=A0A2T6ZUY2_TUBBO|nr:hypothetical protein B9Z19DRAFT_838245 [Tuber borchii]
MPNKTILSYPFFSHLPPSNNPPLIKGRSNKSLLLLLLLLFFFFFFHLLSFFFFLFLTVTFLEIVSGLFGSGCDSSGPEVAHPLFATAVLDRMVIRYTAVHHLFFLSSFFHFFLFFLFFLFFTFFFSCSLSPPLSNLSRHLPLCCLLFPGGRMEGWKGLWKGRETEG